ncbi:MAG: hypothetical protein IJC98_08965 [Clostridia bacterium]|nr:hypothetical protein [Clostridia bacterium]
MRKTVYSLVLSDDVVAQIDRLAYQYGTNRSNMINRILADYVSYVTPEKRMQKTFEQMQNLMNRCDTFKILMQPSESLFSLRSALTYKYNPTVKYTVELYRTPAEDFGELRVSLRTQNAALLLYMHQFFRLWMTVESRYIGKCSYALEDGKFMRRLSLRPLSGQELSFEHITSETLGEWIYSYIDLFDRCLKVYFYYLENPNLAALEIEKLYRGFLNEAEAII